MLIDDENLFPAAVLTYHPTRHDCSLQHPLCRQAILERNPPVALDGCVSDALRHPLLRFVSYSSIGKTAQKSMILGNTHHSCPIQRKTGSITHCQPLRWLKETNTHFYTTQLGSARGCIHLQLWKSDFHHRNGAKVGDAGKETSKQPRRKPRRRRGRISILTVS